jgi:hypothetical protein
MSFTVKVPKEYTIETNHKHKLINVKEFDSSVWVTWVEFDVEGDVIYLKTKDVTQEDDDDVASIELFKEDYEKLIGKK